MNKNIKKFAAVPIIILLLFFDQLTKLMAASHLKGRPNYSVFPGILEFTYHENTGAAFSTFLGKQGFLVTLTLLALLLLLWKYFQIPEGKRYLPMQACFLMLISGAIGNLIDRLRNGYVIDFVYFVPIDFPNFNIADCYMSIGLVTLALFCFFYYKDAELDFLFELRPSEK